MIRRPPRSTLSSSSAASDVYKRQLLECLEQSTPGILGDLMCLVEYEDLVGQLAGRILDKVADCTHGVDSAIRGGIDFEEVEGSSFANGQTGRTGIARLAVPHIGAVDGLG